MSGLEVQGLVARRGSFELGPIDLEIPPGTATALLGPSGAGKTTLLRAIAGFLPLSAGRILWQGRPVDDEPPERRRFGFVPPNLGLFPNYRVRANVAYPLRIAGRSDVEERVQHWLRRFDLEPFAARYPAELSSGERQRVAMARALAAEPAALLWDEPLAALDVDSRDGLMRLLRELLETERVPLVLVTHDPATAAALASHYAVVSAGRVRFVGDPGEFARAPLDRFTARFLGFENLYGSHEIEGAGGRPFAALLRAMAGPAGVVVPPSAIRWTPVAGAEGRVAAVRPTPAGWVVALRDGGLTFHVTVPGPVPGVRVGDAVELSLDEHLLRPLERGGEPA